MREYSLRELLLFEPKDIFALRKKNLLVQRFHNALIEGWGGEDHEHWAELIINEVYLSCAKFKNDDDPTEDVYYYYIETCRENLGRERNLYEPTLLLFCIIIEEYGNQLKSKNISKDIDFEFFVNEIRSTNWSIEDELFWKSTIPSIIEVARKTDMIAFMDICACPPDWIISYCKPRYTELETNNFDQDTIRAIISRYPNKEQQLQMLNIFHNLWKGLDAYGNEIIGDDKDDLPF